eukprot:gene17796-biopygen1314
MKPATGPTHGSAQSSRTVESTTHAYLHDLMYSSRICDVVRTRRFPSQAPSAGSALGAAGAGEPAAKRQRSETPPGYVCGRSEPGLRGPERLATPTHTFPVPSDATEGGRLATQAKGAEPPVPGGIRPCSSHALPSRRMSDAE